MKKLIIALNPNSQQNQTNKNITLNETNKTQSEKNNSLPPLQNISIQQKQQQQQLAQKDINQIVQQKQNNITNDIDDILQQDLLKTQLNQNEKDLIKQLVKQINIKHQDNKSMEIIEEEEEESDNDNANNNQNGDDSQRLRKLNPYRRKKDYDTFEIKGREIKADYNHNVYEKFWEIGVEKEFFKRQNIMNKVAESIFKKNSQGRDEWEQEVQEGEMLVKWEVKEEEGNPQGIFTKLGKKYIRMNRDSIYIASNYTGGYRNIESQIPFEDIISPYDYTMIGKCCQNVYGIEKEFIYGEPYMCFFMDSQQVTWYICSDDMTQLNQWRGLISSYILLWDLRRQGIYDKKEYKKLQDDICSDPIGWNYINQAQWPCNCNEGMLQSPIDLVETQAIRLYRASIVLRYHQGDNLLTTQKWKETQVDGYFGSLIWVQENQRRINAQAYQVRFKFLSEHTLEGKHLPGEIQIYNRDSTGQRIVVSIMLQIDNKQSEKGDEYLNQFLLDTWPDREHHKTNYRRCLDSHPQLVKVLFNHYFSLSFFTYSGSDTLPPCQENVLYLIYQDPLRVSQLVYDRLRVKVVGSRSATNHRSVMPLMHRKVYYRGLKCKQPMPQPEPYGQYIRMDQVQTTYGITDQHTPLGFQPQIHFPHKQLTLQQLTQQQALQQIPPQITQDLIKKQQLNIAQVLPPFYDYKTDPQHYKQLYNQMVTQIITNNARHNLLQQLNTT